MTYEQGGRIQATDFNGFVSSGSPNLNSFWSTGSESLGYGQTAVSTVAQNSLVYALSWANLINAINNSALHQGTSITAIDVPTTSAEISYESTLSSSLTSVYNNSLNVNAVGTDITNSGTRTADWGTNASIPTVSSVITVTFGSYNQARYFFNAGGTIIVSCSRTGGAGSAVDLTWTQMCTDIGTLGLPAVSTSQSIASTSYTGLTQFNGTGETPDIYIRSGFYDLTSTPQMLFRQFAGSSYTSDNIDIEYSLSGGVVTITVNFNDGTTNSTNITGNLTVTAVARPPSTTYISNSWGTPVVAVTAAA